MLSSIQFGSPRVLDRAQPRIESDPSTAHPSASQGRRAIRPELVPAIPLAVRPFFPGLPMSTLTPGLFSSSSMVSPVFPYPGVIARTEELNYLSLAQLQAASQSHFIGELSKLKQPVLTRNYLEFAMLVCNTFRGKLFPCPHCRYVTDRRNNLKRHVSTMHQACDKQLECCGVTFSTKASLREHITIFHHNGYSCPFCGRRFCRKALLKRHLSVHSGQKDYTCPHCDYATSHKSNLERHKRIHARLQGTGLDDISPHDIFSIHESSPHGMFSGQVDIPHGRLPDCCPSSEGEFSCKVKYPGQDCGKHSTAPSDDPEDCEVDIDDDSDNDQMDNDDINVDAGLPAAMYGHRVDSMIEQPINLVTEPNSRASTTAKMMSRLTHGFGVPYLDMQQ